MATKKKAATAKKVEKKRFRNKVIRGIFTNSMMITAAQFYIINALRKHEENHLNIYHDIGLLQIRFNEASSSQVDVPNVKDCIGLLDAGLIKKTKKSSILNDTWEYRLTAKGKLFGEPINLSL